MPSANPDLRDQSLIARVPMRVGGSFHYSPDQEAGGGDAPAKPKTETVSDLKPNDTKGGDDAVKAAVTEALRVEREAVAAQAAKDKEAADRAKAEEEGRWEELAKDNEAKFKAQKEETRKMRVDGALTKYLAAKHPDRVASAIDILPQIAANVDGDAIDAAVKVAAEAFIERNPTLTKPKSGIPSAPVPGSRVATGRQRQQRTSTAGVASSRF